MGYDSIFDPRQLNQVYGAFPFLVYTYHTQFFIHRLNSPRLTQALCPTLLFFRLLFFRPPPRSTGREYRSLTSLHIQLEEKKCIAWIFSFWTMALDSNYGTFAVYLCFLYASLNNVIKTVMKMLCFWKNCKTIMAWFV